MTTSLTNIKPHIFRRVIFMGIICIANNIQAAIHWVSPTGSATWIKSVSSMPLSGSNASTLLLANANAIEGDTIYLRDGEYNLAKLASDGINPTHSGGSPTTMISFVAFSNEIPIFTGGENGFYLNNNSYIRIQGIRFTDNKIWGRIQNYSSYNEIALCTFQSTLGGTTILITGASNQKWVTNNWLHNNHFIVSGQAHGDGGKGCTDGGGDNLIIGQSQGSYINSVCNDNYNTVEANFFEHSPHAAFDNYGMYTVFRNNIIHNEPWSSGCSTYTNPATYSNTKYNGKYAHRNFQITEDYNRVATYVLVEGNRSGHAGANQTNDGADGFSLAAPQNIVRYNYFYNAMNPGLLFKYNWDSDLNKGGHGGTYNRVYSNTFYNNGNGYPWAHTCNLSTCPWPQSNISLYSAASGQGNVVKNNLMYLCTSFKYWGSDVMDKGAPSNGWSKLGSASNNWCTGSQTGGGCSAYGDPKFANPDLSHPESKTLPDLSLQDSSKAIDAATYLTVSTNSGNASCTLTVADAMYFQDGTWGSFLARASTGLGGTMQADWIAIGKVTNVAQIKSVTYGIYSNPAGTIILTSNKNWNNSAPIWLYRKSDGGLVLSGAGPDMGAYEFDSNKPPKSDSLRIVR